MNASCFEWLHSNSLAMLDVGGVLLTGRLYGCGSGATVTLPKNSSTSLATTTGTSTAGWCPASTASTRTPSDLTSSSATARNSTFVSRASERVAARPRVDPGQQEASADVRLTVSAASTLEMRSSEPAMISTGATTASQSGADASRMSSQLAT